ncbi:MAG: Hsp20/alpha crystallin family protein [Fimbriimonadaceae bacterium]|nr:Hsp20/alpha crystallin family protein [Fimbriimonadaceae bacterium]
MKHHLTRWDPFALTPRPGTGHPLFRPSDTLQTSTWVPPLDLTERSDAFEVSVELPGLAADQIEVNYERGTLVVRGEKRTDSAASDGTWYRLERSRGAFSRAVRIAAPVNAEQISASFRDGVLTITLPKAAEAKRHQVQVTS